MQQLILLYCTELVYWLTRIESTYAARFIQWFIRRYNVDMNDAVQKDINSYRSFNAFFTREIDLSRRPLADADWVSPVDGTIAAFGPVVDDCLLQAKGHLFSLSALLASEQSAKTYADGSYINIYLSPRDYHRIHMPSSAKLIACRRVPGTLFSVSPKTAQSVKGLFARNERVIAEFDSNHGRFAMVLVGATNVRAIDTVWHTQITPSKNRKIETYPVPELALAQGAEMGRFNMGSTVIIVAEKNLDWCAEFGDTLRLGQRLIK